MALPSEVLQFRPAESLHVRVGDKLGTKGAPRALDHFIIKMLDEGSEIGDHPLSKNKPREIDVRLLFDQPDLNTRSGIAFWDGKRPACYNNDGGNMAQRRTDTGAYKTVDCDRATCPFWLNASGDSQKVKRTLTDPKDGYAGAYPHMQIDRSSACKVQFYLLFEIPGVTATGECARFYTQSKNSANQILSAMTTILAQTGGILAGLPLKLKVVMRAGMFGSRVPTVTLIASETDPVEWNNKVLEAVQRRELSSVNWKALGQHMSMKRLEDFTGEDSEFIREHFVETRRADAGETIIHADAEVISEPEYLGPDLREDETVARMLDALGATEAQILKLEAKYGDDVSGAIAVLQKELDKRGIEIDDEDAEIEEAMQKAEQERAKAEGKAKNKKPEPKEEPEPEPEEEDIDDDTASDVFDSSESEESDLEPDEEEGADYGNFETEDTTEDDDSFGDI